MVPPESAAADDQMGAAQQHEHPAVGAPVFAEPRREEQGSLSRELLAEEPARGRQGPERSDLRVGDSGDAAPQGRCGDGGQRSAHAGSRGVARGLGIQGGIGRREGRRLHRPRRPAVPDTRRHVLLNPELRAAEPVALRRHRLDLPVPARSQDPARDGEGHPRSADDTAHGECEGAGRDRRFRPRARRRPHRR